MKTITKKIAYIISLGIAMLLPALAFADAPFAPEGLDTRAAAQSALFSIMTGVLSLIWFLLMIFAIIMFMVAAFKFFSAQGEAGEIATARKALMWGVVGLIVAIIAFSLPTILVTFFTTGEGINFGGGGGGGGEGGGGEGNQQCTVDADCPGVNAACLDGTCILGVVAPTGACCVPESLNTNGNIFAPAYCMIRNATQCQNSGGNFRGENTPCPANPSVNCN